MAIPNDIKDKLIFARLKLFNDYPFFAHLAMYLKPLLTEAVPTAAVDAKGYLYLNADFIRKASDQDMVFILAHETMHMVTMTLDRKPAGSNMALFNIASDCVINKMLTDSEMPLPRAEFIKVIHEQYDPMWSKYTGWITEAVYYDLLQNAKMQNVQGSGDGEAEGQHVPGGGSTGTDADGGMKGYWWDGSGAETGDAQKVDDETRAQWKGRVASAQSQAKSAGKMPGALDAFVTSILTPKKDWRKYLRIAAATHLKGKWTWKRIGRRTGSRVRTPGRDKDLPIAACYIDTSGSMSDEELTRCISEVASIIKLCGGKGRLLLGDAEIYYDGEVDTKALLNLKVQRGGTDFRVIFEKIDEEKQNRPAILIGFTDLCGPFPDAPPDFPVIWCVPNCSMQYAGNAPFGSVIEVEL